MLTGRRGRDAVKRALRIAILAVLPLAVCVNLAHADDVLDGRVFTGMIGPSENPELKDSLHFSEGHFWSDICTRCGFEPGAYMSERTEVGVRFTGVLESDSRGQFAYDGVVHDDGTIEVSIHWERKRWYWTSSREIAFRGSEVRAADPSFMQIQTEMQDFDATANPLCARF